MLENSSVNQSVATVACRKCRNYKIVSSNSCDTSISYSNITNNITKSITAWYELSQVSELNVISFATLATVDSCDTCPERTPREASKVPTSLATVATLLWKERPTSCQ